VRRSLLALVLALSWAAPAISLAKKAKKPATAGETSKKKKEAEKLPPPGDKGTNEGAQGRQNATEDAARAGEHPSFDHKP